jgi:NitT/TauT family transport system ATP-binding protein
VNQTEAPGANGSRHPGGTKLEVQNLRIEYFDKVNKHQTLAVDGVDFAINAGEFFSIVGPSGCGKTTIINAIDGLLPITAGRILLDGRAVGAPGPDRAMVFQSPMLLPWRNVIGNISYGLEAQGTSPRVARSRAEELISLVGLDGFARHYPHQLSGGMQQRVNLARALAVDPEILIMDEPFASLDAQTRELMQSELLRIWNQARKTVVFITHQVSEAVFLSDRVAVMTARPGRIKEIVPINAARPRLAHMKREAGLIECEDRIWKLLRPESERADADERVGQESELAGSGRL